jgi:hypothetical protein
VDWYAVPRFPARELPSEDGYSRTIDPRYGRVLKGIPARPPEVPLSVRIFEDHVIAGPSDWREVRKRFRPTTEGRFPDDWQAWCEHSRTARHPIALGVRDIAANINNLMGEELFYASFFEMPNLVREMVNELSELTLMCLEKALKEARVDLALVGSDCTPLIGPNIIKDFFLEAEARHLEMVKSFGIDLICLQGWGDISHLIDLYRGIGVNGARYVMEAGETDYLEDILKRCGESFFIIGALDGRVMLRDFNAIEREIDRKIELTEKHRLIPSPHLDNVPPEVPFKNYRHYAEYLRKAIFGE